MLNGPGRTGELRMSSNPKPLSGKRLASILMSKKTINIKKLIPASHTDQGNLQRKSSVPSMLKSQLAIRYSNHENFLNVSSSKLKVSQSKSQLTEDSYLKAKIANINSRKRSTVGPGDQTPVFFLRKHSVCQLSALPVSQEQPASQSFKRLRESIHYNRTRPSYPRHTLLEDYERQKRFPIQIFAHRRRSSESGYLSVNMKRQSYL